MKYVCTGLIEKGNFTLRTAEYYENKKKLAETAAIQPMLSKEAFNKAKKAYESFTGYQLKRIKE